MPNWAQAIITLIQAASASWTETTPAYSDVKWPWKVSKDFMMSAARQGPYKNMIWAVPQDVNPEDPDDEYGAYKKAAVTVYCYSRATSDLEDDVKNAEIRASNMRDQVRKILVAGTLTGAVKMNPPRDLRALDDPNANPPLFCRPLSVEVLYVES